MNFAGDAQWLAREPYSFTRFTPNPDAAGKAAARGGAETQYKKFAQHLGAQFAQGHRFIDDLPAETFQGDDDAK